MRHAMHELGLEPDVVLVSSARRTLQTLEALEPWEDTPLVEPMDGFTWPARRNCCRYCAEWPKRRAGCCWWGTTPACTNSP